MPSNVKKFALALTTNQVDFELPIRILDMANYEDSLGRILADHRESNRTSFISEWIRTTPDPVENMFGSLTYFAIPKSYLQQGLKLFLLVKDEQQPSMTSFPTEVTGEAVIAQGNEDLG